METKKNNLLNYKVKEFKQQLINKGDNPNQAKIDAFE